MDTFFKRHFRKKPAPPHTEPLYPPVPRRCSMVITTGKGRRRSSAGQASSSLSMQRRCSTTQALPLSLAAPNHAAKREGRRRSSTTTPGLSPRFAVHKRRGGHLHSIDHQLMGPSMLLASLIHMKRFSRKAVKHSEDDDLVETSDEDYESGYENHVSDGRSCSEESDPEVDPAASAPAQHTSYAMGTGNGGVGNLGGSKSLVISLARLNFIFASDRIPVYNDLKTNMSSACCSKKLCSHFYKG